MEQEECLDILSNNRKVKNFIKNSVIRILSKQDNFTYESLIYNNDVLHIIDWFEVSIIDDDKWIKNVDKNDVPKKLLKFSSIEQLYFEADKWLKSKRQKTNDINVNEEDEVVLDKLSNDLFIVGLMTPKSLDRESELMQHCIGYGGYDENLYDSDLLYLSLRDKYNNPHATLEIEQYEVLQLQGKQNKIPNDKYMKILVPWLSKNGYNSKYNYSLIYNILDNTFYEMNKLPNHLETRQNITISYCDFDKNYEPKDFYRIKRSKNKINQGKVQMPEELIVHGNLEISQMQNVILPKKLIVHGTLKLSELNITKLPDELYVGKNLKISSCENLIELPNNLVVNEKLELHYNPNLELKNNLKVKDVLNIDHCHKINKIPENCIVKKLRVKSPKFIFENLALDSDLIIETYDETKLGKNLIIDGNLRINSSKIRKLPDNLFVNGDVIAVAGHIYDFGKNITITGDLVLLKESFKYLPNDVSVLGSKISKKETKFNGYSY